MPKPILLLDTPYLAWRSHHAIGPLSHEGQRTEVLFGLLRDIRKLQAEFQTDRLVFAFDHPPLKRKEIYPQYKNHKLESTKDEIAEKQKVREQIFKIRDEILPELGYRNVFHQEGYEADDVIASIAAEIELKGKAVIVSADADLFQCIRSDIIQCYNPRTGNFLDWGAFVRYHHVCPTDWPKVKALAGCKSDNIQGIPRVGEKTAAKYLAGEIKTTTKAAVSISMEYDEVLKRNLPLVKLPYPGIGSFELKEDWHRVAKNWKKVCRKYGMRRLE